MSVASDLALEPQRPLKRHEYEKLVELGAFDDERVELVYGRIVEMPPQGPAHDDAIQQLGRRLTLALGERAAVRSQSSFVAHDESVPIPDVAVVPSGRYVSSHPSEAYLVVEVAQTSLRKDRGAKARLYAESGVPEYWVVNLVDGLVEVHTEPMGDHYARLQPYRKGESIRLARFADVVIAVDDFLP